MGCFPIHLMMVKQTKGLVIFKQKFHIFICSRFLSVKIFFIIYNIVVYKTPQALHLGQEEIVKGRFHYFQTVYRRESDCFINKLTSRLLNNENRLFEVFIKINLSHQVKCETLKKNLKHVQRSNNENITWELQNKRLSIVVKWLSEVKARIQWMFFGTVTHVLRFSVKATCGAGTFSLTFHTWPCTGQKPQLGSLGFPFVHISVYWTTTLHDMSDTASTSLCPFCAFTGLQSHCCTI